MLVCLFICLFAPLFLKNDLIISFEILQRPYWHFPGGHEHTQKRFLTYHFSQGGMCVWEGSFGVYPAHFLRTVQYFLMKFWYYLGGNCTKKFHSMSPLLEVILGMLIYFLRTIQYFLMNFCADVLVLGTTLTVTVLKIL